MITLLILFQIKHFLADYPFQTNFMLGKFKDRGWILPLLSHSLVHALMTFGIVVFFRGVEFALIMSLLDFIIHFIMDRIKASPQLLGRYKALTKSEYLNATEEQLRSNKYFWWSLGLDQAVHHLTHYFIIFLVQGGTNEIFRITYPG